MNEGILLRTTVDNVTGTLSDNRTRFLGDRPVKLKRFIAQGQNALLALS